MRIFAAALWVLLSVPAFGQSVDPTFQEFEAACRLGLDMLPECEEGVYLTFIENFDEADPGVADCDVSLFWTIRDTVEVPPEATDIEGIKLVLNVGAICA